MKIRLLIADDHAMVRAGIRALVSREEDIEVVGEAANGAEAIAATRSLQPDVVLMDVSMPVSMPGNIDCFMATTEILEAFPKAKVLFLTMHADAECLYESLRAGAHGYLLKDRSSAELVEGIRCVAKDGRCLSPLMRDKLVAASLPTPFNSLSDREREVLRAISLGKQTKEVAAALDIAPKTAEAHIAATMRKLNLHTRGELIRYALSRKAWSATAS